MVLGNEGKGIYYNGTGEQRPFLRRTKTILGYRKHKKHIFDFGGTWEHANLFQENKEIGTSRPLKGLPDHSILLSQ